MAMMIPTSAPFAQELEPRLYRNAPVGLNAFALAYGFSQGNVLFDTSLPIEDVEADLHVMLLAYLRTFNLAGRLAKVDVLTPISTGHWEGFDAGVFRTRDVSGFADHYGALFRFKEEGGPFWGCFGIERTANGASSPTIASNSDDTMTGQRSRDAASDANTEPHGRAARRFRLGAALFLIGLGCPALIPLVATSSLPSAWKTTLSVILAVGIPELFSLAAVAILGKSGFEHLKRLLFGILRRYAPPERVSRTRYRIGLLMFLLPLLFGWLIPYVAHFIPGYEANRVVLGVVGDAMYLVSFSVLGGEFWDKVRALFHHGATAVFPRASAS